MTPEQREQLLLDMIVAADNTSDHECYRVLQKAVDEIESLQEHKPTWAELMEVIDKRYPPDIFPGDGDSTGPRIVALCREIEKLEGEREKLGFLPTTITGRMELQLPTGEWLVLHDGRLGVARESHSSQVQWVVAKENDHGND